MDIKCGFYLGFSLALVIAKMWALPVTPGSGESSGWPCCVGDDCLSSAAEHPGLWSPGLLLCGVGR